MIYLVIATIVTFALAVTLIIMSVIQYDEGLGFIGGVCSFIGIILLICLSSVGWDWTASDYKAEIINNEYGTQYTRAQVFYASDVIETIREIDRDRLEVNGDLLKSK